MIRVLKAKEVIIVIMLKLNLLSVLRLHGQIMSVGISGWDDSKDSEKGRRYGSGSVRCLLIFQDTGPDETLLG